MNRVKQFFCKILCFFNLTDHNCALSITNIGVYILLYKIGTAKVLDWPTASALMITLLSYSHKRYVNAQYEKDALPKVEELDKIKDVINKIREKVSI